MDPNYKILHILDLNKIVEEQTDNKSISKDIKEEKKKEE